MNANEKKELTERIWAIKQKMQALTSSITRDDVSIIIAVAAELAAIGAPESAPRCPRCSSPSHQLSDMLHRDGGWRECDECAWQWQLPRLG